jgi:ThiF family/Prokaryotic E2 family C
VAFAPFFERVYGALGGHLAVSRESLTSVLQDVTVGIRVGGTPRQNDLWIAELSTNLLARLYPRLAISGPEKNCSALRDLALKINPKIEITKDAPGMTSICLGSAVSDDAVFPKASGWVASVRHGSSKSTGPENPYAAGMAAAMGCAELFRRVFLKTGPERDVSVSLLNFDDKDTGSSLELGSVSVGDVLFVGVGAVGNAALWPIARHSKIEGRLWLVDAEKVTLSNLQRYVLTTYADVDRSKVQLGREAVAATELRVESNQCSLEQFSDLHSKIDIPTTVITIDNVDGRRSAQALLPRLIVNGWTGDQALGVSWHLFSRDAACLACLYHPRGQGVSATEQAAKTLGLEPARAALLWVTRKPLSDEDIRTAASTLGVDEEVLSAWRGKPLGELYTDVVCGAVPLDVKGVGKLETVPLAHQSTLAGILTATELLKRTQPELAALSQSEPLVSWDNVLQSPPAIWTKPRAREPGCICGDADYQRIYQKKWGSGDRASSPV